MLAFSKNAISGASCGCHRRDRHIPPWGATPAVVPRSPRADGFRSPHSRSQTVWASADADSTSTEVDSTRRDRRQFGDGDPGHGRALAESWLRGCTVGWAALRIQSRRGANPGTLLRGDSGGTGMSRVRSCMWVCATQGLRFWPSSTPSLGRQFGEIHLAHGSEQGANLRFGRSPGWPSSARTEPATCSSGTAAILCQRED